ncbi:hypothetical protein, partial [Escherichia coli]|uniref:hypothetical protein n=1 Tax=Escherichia coli TaxID=562 RepID=UPI001412C7DB
RFRLCIELLADRFYVTKLKRMETKGGGYEYRFVKVAEKGYPFNNARYTELLELRRDQELNKKETKELEKLERQRDKVLEKLLKLIDPNI